MQKTNILHFTQSEDIPPFGSVVQGRKATRSYSTRCTRWLVGYGCAQVGRPSRSTSRRNPDRRRHRRDDVAAIPAGAAADVGRNVDAADRTDDDDDRR